MTKYVKAFLSMDSRRNFLKSIGRLDELMLLEEELGNFKGAAEIAKLRGDLPREADLLGKAGHLKEASLLIMSFVLHHSLWMTGNRGWPFRQKQVLVKKAMSLAQQESDELCERVRRDVEVLSHERNSLHELLQSFTYSELCKNLTVQMISIRRILDAHLDCTTRKFEWEDELQFDIKKHSEDKISLNHVSISTLMYFWNTWKWNMSNIMQYLKSVEKPDDNEWLEYGEFCLNYFGVRRQFINSNVAYILLNPDAQWVKATGSVFKRQSKDQVSIDGQKFASAALSHCQAEVVSVSQKVLETVEALYKLSISESFSLFRRSMCLIDVYQVMKYLTESFKFNDSVKRRQVNFLRPPITYYDYVFPLDCCKSLEENMISLRKTELSRSLLEEVIVENISNKGDLTYGQIGRVVRIWLGSGKPTDGLYVKIAKRFDKNFFWRAFIDSLQVSSSKHAVSGITESRSLGNPSSNTSGEDQKKHSLIDNFHKAMRDTWFANWWTYDYMSPDCFIYLVERLLVLVFHSEAYFFTTKYSFVEWLIYLKADTYPDAGSVADMQLSPECIFDSVVKMVEQLLCNKQETAIWIAKSKINVYQYHPLLTLRLVVILCLLHLNSGRYFNVLSHLLDQSDISSQLPRNQDWFSLNGIVEAFQRIGNPLVIVHLRENSPKFVCPAITVDTALTPRIDDIMRNLFPKKISYHQQRPMVEANVPDLCEGLIRNADISAAPCQKMSSNSGTESKVQMNSGLSEKISDVLASTEKRQDELSSCSPNLSQFKEEMEESISFLTRFQEELEQSTSFLTAGLNAKKFLPCDRVNLFSEASSTLDEIKQLTFLFDASDVLQTGNLQEIGSLLKSLQSKRPRLEAFLNQLIVRRETASWIVSDAEPEEIDGKILFKGTDNTEPEGVIGKFPEERVKNWPSGVASASQNNDNAKASQSKQGKRNNKKKDKRRGKGGRKK